MKGAFIQTQMMGIPVYVQCRGKLKDLILKVLPYLREYLGSNGVLYCRLRKALYRCVQASKLWYERLRAFLRTLGYEQSETDPCVFRRIVENRVYLFMVYVDDLLIFASDKELKWIEQAFTKEFCWITMEIGMIHSYLGMQLEFADDKFTIDMTFYLEKILGEFPNLKEEALLGKKDLVVTDQNAVALLEKASRSFHTVVAKLLYLSWRARPDIITSVGFLCTRVKAPAEDDNRKLQQVLGYLLKTKKKVLVLRQSESFKVVAYIDMSYAIHNDGKSHSGLVVFVGGMTVFCAS